MIVLTSRGLRVSLIVTGSIVMNTRKVAIACQGGGIHGAFTCGVLTAILKAKEEEQQGRLPKSARRSFEIIGLSGTSAGALNAFTVWYGMMAKGDKPGSVTEARRALNYLWDTFQVQKSGEHGMNTLAQQFYKLQELGVIIKQPLPAHFYDWLMSALSQWSAIENVVAPSMNLGEIRPEFYDFLKLLRTCAPEFASIQAALNDISKNRTPPRLLLGAVEILSGQFEAFDSWRDPATLRNICYEAVAASGTLPDVRRSQRIPGLKNADDKDALFWDGSFSQNPPVREFAAGTDREHTPDEI